LVVCNGWQTKVLAAILNRAPPVPPSIDLAAYAGRIFITDLVDLGLEFA
jgi:hypothetical protein